MAELVDWLHHESITRGATNTATGYIPSVKKTNADRFRAKSDEELAKTLSGEEIYPWCKESCKYINCYDCVLAWLKQEAEDG